jgi:hypothetical protein
MMKMGPQRDGEIIGDLGDDWVTMQGGQCRSHGGLRR